MQAIAEAFITDAEYLAMEEASEEKHEYYNGRIYPVHPDMGIRGMAGATPTHNTLSANALVAIGSRLRGKSCRGTGSDQRVKVEKTGIKTYPDVLVVCPPERFDADDANSLLNPRVIIEVLSPSTEKYDRTDKFDHYKQIESLTDYILIAQDRVRVEHHQRGDGGLWTLRSFNERSHTLLLPDIEIELPLEELYDRLDLPQGLQARMSPEHEPGCPLGGREREGNS